MITVLNMCWKILTKFRWVLLNYKIELCEYRDHLSRVHDIYVIVENPVS
jgi:hypothetical protein